jgi:tRNA U34 5-methylaminomethyl-2-thiouridine-forming methyltransferase MnmC
MDRKIILTGDGSHSVYTPDLETTYHSRYGAITESKHVFIDCGLMRVLEKHEQLSVFEMGFGTGLNALLTMIESEKKERKIRYHAVEKFPLEKSYVEEINYCQQLDRPGLQVFFRELHNCVWEEDIFLFPSFIIHKIKADINSYTPDHRFHLIYYDAFAPAVQPELWTESLFRKLFSALLPGGMLLTYCSKGDVRRAMLAAGFSVEKLPGPPHKREIIRAIRNQ